MQIIHRIVIGFAKLSKTDVARGSVFTWSIHEWGIAILRAIMNDDFARYLINENGWPQSNGRGR
jgi:hypothetical protein